MSRKKLSILGIILYVLAAAALAYGIYAFINVHKEIVDLIDQGMTTEGQEFGITNYYMNNTWIYAFSAIVLAALGWLMQKTNPVVEAAGAGESAEQETQGLWFNSNGQTDTAVDAQSADSYFEPAAELAPEPEAPEVQPKADEPDAEK